MSNSKYKIHLKMKTVAKKKKKPIRHTTQPKAVRIARARNWLTAYTGTRVVRAYHKKFHVDLICAARELQEIGCELKPGYIENLIKSEAARVEHRRARKAEKLQSQAYYNDFQDDTFYFIAGYTSGGAPYGLTWFEMGLDPYEDELEPDEEIICPRHYDFLSPREKNWVDNKLREDFSRYVSTYRRLPGKNKQKQLIEPVFENCPGGPLVYSNDFSKIYRKINRKRENKFIREGILPRRFTATDTKKLFEQSVMLESENMIFRKLTDNDFDDLAEMLRDPEVTAAWGHIFTDDQIRDWITNQNLRYRDQVVGLFAAILKDTSEFIGQIGLLWNDFGELRALEVSYMLKRRYWGMGYAAEGAAALTRYGFSFIGVDKVYASIRPENERSVRVAERIGMKAEGSFVKLHAGKEMEHIIYSCERSTGNANSSIS